MLDGHTPNEVAEMSAKERYSDAPVKDERIGKALKHIYEAIDEFEVGVDMFKKCGITAIHMIVSETGSPSLLISPESWDSIQEYCKGDTMWTEHGSDGNTIHMKLEHDGLIITTVERKG